MRMFKILITLLSFLFCQVTFSQTEYLVRVNPYTGQHSFVDSIPGVVYIASGKNTLDEVNGRYIFTGLDSNYNASLYSVDLNSGATISSPSFPVGLSQFDNIGSLIFNNSDSTLYGLMYENASQTEYLVSIDPASGVHTIIDSISGVLYVTTGTEVIDEVNNTYSFRGTDASRSASNFYTVDLTTGALLSNPTFPNSINMFDVIYNIKQDTLNSLLGIFKDYNSSVLTLVGIDKTTGVHTTIDTLSDYSNYIPFNSVYNKSSKIYSFAALDSNRNSRYYNYDVNNGNLITNPLYPILPDTNDNIGELHIDNSTGNIYGLYYDAIVTLVGLNEFETNSSITVFPNPAKENLKIQTEQENIDKLELFTNIGQQVYLNEKINDRSFILNVKGFKSGVYFLKITIQNSWLIEKVIIK